MIHRSLSRRALAALALLALVGGACGDDDDGGSASDTTGDSTVTTASGTPETTDDPVFNPDTDDATQTICESYAQFVADGDETALLNINLSSDVLELPDVRDASFFLMENPNPTGEEDQRQFEDALVILEATIGDSALCEGVGRSPDDGVFDPDFDDATVTICESYFEYAETGDENALLNINLSSDVLGLAEVRDASFFLMENPNPADEEAQRQFEDSLSILQTEIAESGICTDLGGDPPPEGDLTLAMCDEWAAFEASGDTASLETILPNADLIGLSEAGIDALTFLIDNPSPAVEDQEQHEGAIAVATEEFAAICG